MGQVALDRHACPDKYKLLIQKQHFVGKQDLDDKSTASGICCKETELELIKLLQGLIDMEKGYKEEPRLAAIKKNKRHKKNSTRG